ncbi:MAG TPA: hypothetical protein VFE60_27040 [Roseiarcus sp.]|nr:hypothetical protein [Roseiarcus sp.]
MMRVSSTEGDTAQPQLTAYLLSILVHHDRGVRAIGPPRNRQEWGIGRIGDYLRAVGREEVTEGGEAALWELLRGSIALLPSRREEALLRLIRAWAPLEGWLDDQDIPAPVKPTKYRLPAA